MLATLASNLPPSKPFLNSNSRYSSFGPLPSNHPSNHNHTKLSLSISGSNPKPKPPNATSTLITPIATYPHCPLPPLFTPSEPRKASDVLVEALEGEGVTHVFAYPGGASMEIHQALTRSKLIKTILPRHEQGGILASIGYARASGRPSVCIATSGPGATNLVTGLADAMADSVPVVAITGQVSRTLMGKDGFQEVATTDIAKSITKHVYLVLDPSDIPRVIKEAFYIAKTGRPGPVLIDIPKDVQQEMMIAPQSTGHMKLHGYISKLSKSPKIEILQSVVDVIFEAKNPVLYIGGGCVHASEELRRFVELTGIPVASTMMGLGVIPSCDNDLALSLGMLGMHGTMYANYAVNNSDLLLAFGVRFDDRVTGKIEAKIVHIDIDASELRKNTQPNHVTMHSDIKVALQAINYILAQRQEATKEDLFLEWRNELRQQKLNPPLIYETNTYDDIIQPRYVIEVLDDLTKGNAIITTGVGQDQMFVAQYYKFKSPGQFLSSGGLGTMGFGLPTAIGAAVAQPGRLVIDVDGDGSYLMNIQELATIGVENLPVKIMILNNQHLGMAVQHEDTSYEENRTHTFLGIPGNTDSWFPNMVKFAEACDVRGERVSKIKRAKGSNKKND